MIKIELPSYEEFEKIRVRLDEPRIVEYKDNRKTNQNIKTNIPKELEKQEEKKGVYIILKENKSIGYIGNTENLNKRMRIHTYLKKNSNIKFIYFLELEDKTKRFVFEILYKYYYFGKVRPEYFVH